MALWGGIDRNPLPLAFGLANIALSAFCMLTFALLNRHPGQPGRQTHPAHASPQPDAGMTLLVSLLMLALLSGMALHAIVAAGMNLRFARERLSSCILRTAGSEAVWTTLRDAASLPPDSLSGYSRTIFVGPGIESATSISEVDRSLLPPPFLVQQPPLFGRFFSITAKIKQDSTTREIRALACLVPSGEWRILNWAEPL